MCVGFYIAIYVRMYNLQEIENRTVQLNKEISDGETILEMKQSKIDDLEKNLKSITAKYLELKLNVC